MVPGFDAQLFGIVAAHPSILVGTCNAALVPTLARGLGARVTADGRALEVLVARWPGPEAEANLAATGRVAATFTSPEDYVGYQVKGRVLDLGAARPEDHALLAAYVAGIQRRMVAIGEPDEMARAFFAPRDCYRMRMAPEAVFRQTPGPNAGARVET